eukprot:1907209-Rhodomonas_salina.1
MTTAGAAGMGRQPTLPSNATGFPQQVSLAALGGQDADLLAGRSVLPSQSRDPLTSGGAPAGN